MSRSRAFVVVVAACAASATACSFLAFDDYTSDPANPAPDAAANTDAPSSNGDAVSPGSDATVDGVTPDSGANDKYGDVIRGDGPIAWYRFEEAAGATIAQDSAGSKPATQVAGAMGFGAAGISGRGLAVPNGSLGLTPGNVFGFAGATPFSYEVWIKPVMRIDGHGIFGKRQVIDGGFAGFVCYLKEDFSPHFEIWGTQLFAASNAPIPSGWVHLVVTVAFTGSSGTTRLYLNAQQAPIANPDPIAETPATEVDLVLLAKFAGDADELAIYDKALTAAQVQAHYVAGKPP